MILRLFNLENCHTNDMDLNYIYVLECQHKTLFKNILANLKGKDYNQIEIGIIAKDNLLDLNKSCYVITDFLDFSVSSKALLTKIYNKIIFENSSNIDIETEFQSIFCEIIKNIENLINYTEINLQMVSKIDTKDFFQFADLSLVESENPLERILDFIQLNSYIKLYDIIVLVNPKSIFTDQEMTEIYRFSLYNKVKILILDSLPQDKTLQYEKRISIDEDLYDNYL